MLCVFSLFSYFLYDIQKMPSHTSKVVILILYLYVYKNFASAPILYFTANLQIVIYNLHHTLHFAG